MIIEILSYITYHHEYSIIHSQQFSVKYKLKIKLVYPRLYINIHIQPMKVSTNSKSPPILILHTKLLLLLFSIISLLISKEGKENIVSNLNSINVKKTLRRRNKRKVDSMRRNPNRPTSHNRSLEIRL